ncbi:56_t:CDS:2 [Paraglomus occultum]|uniref:56_t:CDS:1 n=1 Tax=Paraglomus occultum TaxID=144539 RepID=A0A9N9GMU4_9GLOM|nr:56_t:CDS:2 [Paraglomus occultum]
MTTFKALIAILFTLLFVQFVTPIATRTSQTVADAVNAIRSQLGLSFVNDNPILDDYSYNYLYDWAQGTKTTLVEGDELIRELAAAGYSASWAGMTWSRGYTPAELVYSLYEDPDGYQVLSSNYLTDVGAEDFVASDGTEYIVAVFAQAAGSGNRKRATLDDIIGNAKFAAKSGDNRSIAKSWNSSSFNSTN